MNLSMPLPSEYQIINYSGSTIMDAEGNHYMRIEESKPSSPFTYLEQLGVDAFSRQTKTLPSSYAVPPEYSLYLQPSANTESDDPRIRALALQAVEGAQDPFERITKLAIFVNSYLEYDASLVGQEKSALWALENRRGVCTEYAALYAALARSIGIPARYVSGYAQSEKLQGFVGHAWNEAYIGQWVPVDATWFEVGNLDALHIEEAKYAENRKRNTVSASVNSPSAYVEWETPGQGGASAGYVQLLSASYGKPRDDYGLSSVRATIAPGGSTVVYLALQGKEYMAMPVTLATCSGANIIDVKAAKKFAILRPGEEIVLAWEITAEKSLQSNYVYTCPLTLNSPYLATRSITITVDPAKATSKPFTASLSSQNSSQGEPNSILISSPSALSGATFFAFLPDGVQEKKISGKSGELQFSSPWPGQHEILVASSSGGVEKLSLSVAAVPQDVSILSLSLAGALKVSEPASAKAEIASSHYPADITMEFSSCGGGQSSSARLSAPASFQFCFTPAKEGACTLSLQVREVSTGSAAQKGIVAEVSPKPAASSPQPRQGSNQQEAPAAPPCALPLSLLAVAAFAAAAGKR